MRSEISLTTTSSMNSIPFKPQEINTAPGKTLLVLQKEAPNLRNSSMSISLSELYNHFVFLTKSPTNQKRKHYHGTQCALQLPSVKIKQTKQLNRHPLLHITNMMFSLNSKNSQHKQLNRYCHVMSRNIYQSTNTL